MYLSYNELSKMIEEYEMPKELLKKNWVVVANGGLFIAQRLTFHYGKRIGFFDPNTMVKTDETTNVLLIEDVVGTGKTLRKCKEVFPKSKLLSFLYDPSNLFKPDYYIYKSTEWIVFPWEKDNEGCKKGK